MFNITTGDILALSLQQNGLRPFGAQLYYLYSIMPILLIQ